MKKKTKKKIKIAHLYYDLMNLYGEAGNIRALETFIKRQNVDVDVTRLSLKDEIDFQKYDFYYIGQGSEENELLVLSDLNNYIDDIKKAVEAGKMFLVTGNAFELFGTKMVIPNAKDINCLGIFDYNSVWTERLVSELFYKFDELEEDRGRDIVGFKNCNFNIVNNDENRLFEFADSFHYKNFFGMSFVGPVLIRNPYFTNFLLKRLFTDLGLYYTPIEDTNEFDSYHTYVKNFITNANLD